MDELLTEEWLSEVGFKWHQLERQPTKHWTLWLGGVLGRMQSFEDLGIEVAYSPNSYRPDESYWFCWLRGDSAGRYHRFIHIRHIGTRRDLIRLVEGLTGYDWNPENHLYGNVYTPEQAARIRKDDAERLDRQIMHGSMKWYEVEKDDTRGRALPEHLEAHAKANE